MLMVEKEPTPMKIKEQKIYLNLGLTEIEYKIICDQILNRLPNYTELGLFSVMWSEHCSYRHSKSILKQLPTSGQRVLQGPGEGAGIVDIGDNLAVVFKIESHNHPSAIEPFEGAATGVGGIIRDIFSMGAKPIALLDSLRFGELDHSKTKYLMTEIVSGISNYGNCVGIPTVGGEIAFDTCYEDNPLVNAMCVGLIHHKDIQTGQAKGVGNIIMYVGAKTGRDGIHGATFASEEFVQEENQQRSAVQVGDPFMEKLLLDACLELTSKHADSLIGIQDMGAAGLISSSSEMADKADMGMLIHLDHLPQREDGMTPYEMMLSESQERMLLCIKKGHEQKVENIFKKYNLDAVAIGIVTDDRRYRINHQGKEVANVPVTALTQPPIHHKTHIKFDRIQHFSLEKDFQPMIKDPATTLLHLLQQPTIASKRCVYETYDSQVLTNTVILPGSDAAVLRIRGTEKALALTTDCNSRYLYLNPKIGGQIAVAEAARNIVASGGRPLAITDCLNYGSPEKEEVLWELNESVAGIAKACNQLGIPAVSGNVSLYNETNEQAIYPTSIIGMVGQIEKMADVTTQFFKKADDLIYLIGETKPDFNRSELQKMQLNQIAEGRLMDFDLATEKQHQELVLAAIQAGMVVSAHDCSEGGVGVALAEACFENDLGINVTLDFPSSWLFSETQSRFILSISPEKQQVFEQLIKEHGICIGSVTQTKNLVLNTVDHQICLDLQIAKKSWEDALPCLLK